MKKYCKEIVNEKYTDDNKKQATIFKHNVLFKALNTHYLI